MKIIKITNAKKTCENCEKSPAELSIALGTKSLQFCLCKSCAWDLAEMLDKTTAIDFQIAEK